ncbi:MAG: hypothetical protein HYX68_28670 [Planctomycetes bacterium]|nr:hypothetical protein [Planctomycetota bacterium]
MKYLSAILCMTVLSSPAFSQGAGEKVEKRIAELVAPAGVSPGGSFTAKPVAWPASGVVTRIAAPLKPYAGLPARLPILPRKVVTPPPLRAGVPLAGFRDDTPLPAIIELPTQPLLRLPSRDASAPAPLPILAQPKADRASLGDPSFEASVAVALKDLSPSRDEPVPFLPLNLPDPFEHLRYGQLRNPPEESAMPPVIPLDRPTKR